MKPEGSKSGERPKAKPTRRRTRGRELALQFLYMLDLRGPEVMDQIQSFLGQETRDREVHEFAFRLISGAFSARMELDCFLAAIAHNWDIRRMAVVDRNILRMAIFELVHCADIPPKVTINEAIELGKRFSTANSGSFINGILDRVKNQHAAHKNDQSDKGPAPPPPVGHQPEED